MYGRYRVSEKVCLGGEEITPEESLVVLDYDIMSDNIEAKVEGLDGERYIDFKYDEFECVREEVELYKYEV